jgi:hypothetical protein
MVGRQMRPVAFPSQTYINESDAARITTVMFYVYKNKN